MTEPRSLLRAYFEHPVAPRAREVVPSISLEHALWDGRDARGDALDRAAHIIAPLVDQQESVAALARELVFLLAELSGQELSCSHLAHRLRLAPRLILRLLGALELAGFWRHISCFDRQHALVDDKSKGYVVDVGLVCQFLGVTQPAAIAQHPAWGAIFETFVVNRIAALLPAGAELFFWRTVRGGAEVDVVVSYQSRLYPIEIKSAQHVSVSNARKIEVLTRFYEGDFFVAPGIIVYSGQRCYTLDNGTIALPWALL